MNPETLKRLSLWMLIFVAAGIAFWTSFHNALDMASIVRTDADGILRVKILNSPGEAANSPLRLQLEYRDAEKVGPDGKPLPLSLPKPLVAVLVNENKQVVARLGEPDASGNLPAVENIPADEKYFWVAFPQITEGGKPVSLLIRNPLYVE